jgi:DNA-directed RNA polymerase specialized sigma24 family protein
MATSELQDFLAVLRNGDAESVERLLSEVEPVLRDIIRLRQIDGRLRRVADTTDIFHSLLKDFLVQEVRDSDPARARGGLTAYLAAAVRNKILRRLRKERRNAGGLPDGWEPVSPEPPADRRAEGREALQAIRDRLDEANRRLFDLKLQGLIWPEIAERVGGRPDALRMRLNRAVADILGELGYED